MDEKDAYCYIIDQTDNQTRICYLKKTLQFLVPISITYFLVSYFSVFPIIFHQLHFYSSIIYPFLAQALDRKCMFLLFNGILAFLKLNTSPLNYGGFSKSFDGEDGADQLPEMPVFQENAYVDHTPSHAAIPEEKVIQEVPQHHNDVVSQEVENETVMLDSQEWEEDDDNEEEEEEEEEEEVEQTAGVEDMRVSTEDLNKKFDEFIRKMKEEIRNTI